MVVSVTVSNLQKLCDFTLNLACAEKQRTVAPCGPRLAPSSVRVQPQLNTPRLPYRRVPFHPVAHASQYLSALQHFATPASRNRSHLLLDRRALAWQLRVLESVSRIHCPTIHPNTPYPPVYRHPVPDDAPPVGRSTPTVLGFVRKFRESGTDLFIKSGILKSPTVVAECCCRGIIKWGRSTMSLTVLQSALPPF